MPIRDQYQARLEARRASRARLAGLHRAAWWAWSAASVALIVVLVRVSAGRMPAAWLWAPAAAIAATLAVRMALSVRLERLSRAVAFHQGCLSRLDGAWGTPPFIGEEFTPPGHPYALDLDVVGPRSLFTRLSTARTRPGAATLARWLLGPASAAEVRARQEAVRELAGRLDLREALALAGRAGAADVDGEALAAWGEGPALLPWRRWRGPLLLLALASPVAVAGAAAGWWRLWPVLAALGAAAAVHLATRRRVEAATGEALRALARLETLAGVLRILEAEPFATPRLRALREAVAGGARASRALARLGKVEERVATMRSQLGAALGYALLWPVRNGVAAEAWRAAHGPRLRGWLGAIGELEALVSLAARADEHPGDPFPEVVEAGEAGAGGPLLEATGLGHPLLDPARCVPNDLRLGGEAPRLLLVSGSNMSGKSTLLRAVGTNVVLALAGAPVRAARLRVTPLAVGASLRVHDSVLDGESRFLAEVTRLRDVVALTGGPLPVLFVLDEVLHGTNSHDRAVGAEAILRKLVERGAVGLCSTHDLALAAVADRLGARAANAHFGDRLEGGRLVFDFKLRPGVVQHSNALALMRSVGLEV